MPWQPFRRKARHRRLEEESETSFSEELLPRSASDGNLLSGSGYGVSGRVAGGSSSPWAEFRSHVLEEGETLAGLSLRYNITIQDIKAINKIWTNDGIWAGRVLQIPIVESSSTNLDLSGSSACPSETLSIDSQLSTGVVQPVSVTDSGISSRMLGLTLEGDASSASTRSFNSSPISLPLQKSARSPKMAVSASSSSPLLPGIMPHKGSVEDLSSFLSAMDSSIEINKKASISLIKSSDHGDQRNNNS